MAAVHYSPVSRPADPTRNAVTLWRRGFQNIGATGEFPKGKIAPEDEGEIAFAVGHRDGKVVIDFGKSVAWLGMEQHQAIALANTILSHANVCQIIGNKSPDIRHKAKVR